MAADKKSVPALRLSLGHAPSTWHVIDNLPGFYHPDIPSPLGGIGEATVEQAQAAAADPGCPAELCRITPGEADNTRNVLVALRQQARRAVLSARSEGLDSPQHVTANTSALTSKE